MRFPFLLGLVVGGFARAVFAAEITDEPLATIKRKVAEKKAVLVDVREKEEWENGHIEGAVFLPLSKLRRNADAAELAKQLPKDKVIYTHCAVGRRAVTAGKILEKLGYKVHAVKLGYEELVEAGFPKAKD